MWNKLKQLMKDEEGITTVEIILILVVLIALVLIFKEQMTNIVNNIFKTITSQSNKIFMLPDVYEGNSVTWRKKPDTTFLLVFLLMIMAVFLIKLGGKRDQESAKKDRLEFLEKEYAKLVSKFTMLLSAGLSIRNAWERIVLLYRRKGDTEGALFQELNWGFLQMQKGVSELEGYEAV